jgi:hypothetical protein
MRATEISGLFAGLRQHQFASAAMHVAGPDDVWDAIRQFFQEQARVPA